MARKDRVVGNSHSSLEGWLRGMANCTLIMGRAGFLSPTSIRVGDEALEADRFFINVGCRAAVPDFPGIDRVRTLTNTTLLKLDALPSQPIIVGGSYIGLEFARFSGVWAPQSQWWRRRRT
jgi:pyruvate/2-oxoglutarate dehydrogenase complex dihydrolipoamide dehydrogenase (E3) component